MATILDSRYREIKSFDDSKPAILNSRSYTQASGNSIAFQAKPSQTVTTTGEVIGGEISPRTQDLVGAGVLKGLHIDLDMKGSGAATIGTERLLELEAVGGAGKTVTNDLQYIRMRLNQNATVSGDVVGLSLEAKEAPSVAWSAFAKFGVDAGLAAKHTSAGTALPADVGWIRVKIGDTFYKLPAYND